MPDLYRKAKLNREFMKHLCITMSRREGTRKKDKQMYRYLCNITISW